MPTLAALAGVDAPSDTDGVSLVPTLLGAGEQRQHEVMYWEHMQSRAARMGDWKLVHPRPDAAPELYDLKSDESETTKAIRESLR